MLSLLQQYKGYLLGGAFALAYLLLPELAWAAPAAGANNESLQNLAQIGATLVHVGTAIALIIIQFMPAVWGTDLIIGPAATEGLTIMWIYVRNLANIAFVGLILVVAGMNMVTSGGNSNWSIKAKLGPIILGLVAINFSMLAVRVMVDAVNVGTVALLALADPVIEARGVDTIADYYDKGVNTEDYSTCENPGTGDCKSVRKLLDGSFCPSGKIDEDPCLFKIRPSGDIQEAAQKMDNPEKKNVMMAFGFFFMHLEMLPLLSAKTESLFTVLDSVIFSLILGVAYLIALIAIFVVLIIRVVMMWLFIVFSPLLVSSWVLGFQLPGNLTEQFWKYLLVPVKVAGALAFSLIMLSVLDTMILPPEKYTSMIEPGAGLKKFWGPEEFGGWMLVWKILTVVLFWKVVFMAMEGLEGASEIVDKIKGFGAAAGSTALAFAGDRVPIPGLDINGKPLTLASLMSPTMNPTNILRGMRNEFAKPGQLSLGGAARAAAGAGQENAGVAEALNRFSRRRNANETDARTELRNMDRGQTRNFLDNATPAQLKHIGRMLGLTAAGRAVGVNENSTREQIRVALDNAEVAKLFRGGGGTTDDAPTPPANDITVSRAGDEYTFQVDGSPLTVNANGSDAAAKQASAYADLKTANLGVDKLQKILELLKQQDAATWGSIDEATFIAAAS